MSRLTYLALCALALLACDSDPAEAPYPGTLAVSLSAPNPLESALLVRITGPDLSDLRVVSATHVLHVSSPGPDETQAIILGDITSGPLLLFDVPDVTALEKYSVQPLQVAAPAYVLRDDLGQYGFSLAPQ